MKKNQVGLDAQIAQLLNAPLKVAKEISILASEIPLAVAYRFQTDSAPARSC